MTIEQVLNLNINFLISLSILLMSSFDFFDLIINDEKQSVVQSSTGYGVAL